MRNHFLHALILFCGNTATEMTNPLASIGAMGYHFGNTVNKEDLRMWYSSDVQMGKYRRVLCGCIGILWCQGQKV